MNTNSYQKDISKEKNAIELIKQFAQNHKEELMLISGWGDGRCGYIAEIICSEIGIDMPFSSTPKRPAVSEKRRMEVYRKNNYSCVICGSGEDLSIDHIKPVSKGGTNDFSNLQTLCRSCNSKKGNKEA